MITLVIPVYKIKEEYLRKCLDSILNQTNPKWQAILVDDGSPDKCGNILDEYANKDKRFTVIHKENQGVSTARNSGLERVKTTWVTFVDPDDWIEETYVEKVLDFLNKNTETDILAFGYAREFTGKSKVELLCSATGKIDKELLYRMRLAPLNRLIINGKVYFYTVNAIWNKVYRKEYLSKIDLTFESTIKKGEDRIFNVQALDRTDNVYYLNALLYHYRNDNEESSVNRFDPNTVKSTKDSIEVMKKWIIKNDKSIEYKNMLNCWTCTRFQEFMRLYIFNKNSDTKYRDKKKELNSILNQEPFSSALKMKDQTVFTNEEKIFLFFLKRRQYWVCKYLICAREFLKCVKKRKIYI